ncbi:MULTISPECIES: type II toxin-antitoxin system RelB/DinJ family antitoxin [Pelistega]|uniref:type II toxin-antitoxin system RelB/DinJ family antitoxin n=1 Tax=Pelistega TaxID=106146 RepID=UPI000410CF6F|nr:MULTISPECIES: type II toxin-antitoxin system RelB/DinJ family antitoxin [Pelistega]
MSTNFNLRLDDQLKNKSFSVIESFGLTPSQFIRLVLKQVADTESLPLSFEKRRDTLSKNGEKLLLEAIEDVKQGRTTRYERLEDFVKAVS